MSRGALAWATVCLALMGTGCTMGQHPYDYSGPVVCGPNPEPGYVRAGSILSGAQQPMPGSELSSSDGLPTPAPTMAPERKAVQATKPPERSLILEEKPSQTEGRRSDQRLPEGWGGSGLPSAIPPSLVPQNGKPQ
jgi:hypothetical protein